MMPIVESVVRNSLVCKPQSHIRGVTKAILSQPKTSSDPIKLITDGVNIQVCTSILVKLLPSLYLSMQTPAHTI